MEKVEECKYCMNGKKCYWYEEIEEFEDFPNPHMDCHIDREGEKYSLVVDNAVSCKINYCPMCGRRLY